MKRLAVLLVTCCLAGLASPALAADETLDAIAEARFKEGIAFAKQGNYEKARASFLQTLALSPNTPKVILNLAIAEHGSGRGLDALGHLKTYLAHPNADPAKVADLKKTLYADLWSATGHLRIAANRGEPIVLDRETKLGNAPLPDVVDVSPGSHVISAGARIANVDVAAGETKEVALSTTDSPEPHSRPGPPVHSNPPPHDNPEPPPSNASRNIVVGSLAGIGVTGIALSIGFFLGAGSASDDLERAKQQTGTGPDACAGVSSPACETRAAAADSVERNTALGWTTGIVGSVALAGGLVAFIVWPTSPSPSSPSRAATRSAPRISPWFGETATGLTFKGDF